jgi:uncharacterized protein DUF2637
MSARTQELLDVTAAQGGTAEAASTRPETAPRAWRILGLAAVCLGLAALAAATFVLSYSGIRAVALEAGITPRLARGYPLLLDAMLVIALAAVLALRGAGLPSKVLAWLTLLVVLAAAAGADGLHAAGRTLPRRPATITAAVLPWALVFIAFALLLSMLRHARLRRAASARVSVAPHGPARAHWQPALQDPASAEASAEVATEPPTGPSYPIVKPFLTVPRPPDSYLADPDVANPEPADPEPADPEPADPGAPGQAPTEPAQDAADDDEGMPVFHRMWSAPTPPEA